MGCYSLLGVCECQLDSSWPRPILVLELGVRGQNVMEVGRGAAVLRPLQPNISLASHLVLTLPRARLLPVLCCAVSVACLPS